jgi:hypothetical protein
VRTRKTLALPKTRTNSPLISRQLDLGFEKVPFLVRFDWLEPSILRLIELGTLTALFAITDNLGVASFVVLFSIAFHHYDNLYRSMQNEQKPAWAKWLGLSGLGRLAAVSITVLSGWYLPIVAMYFFIVFLIVSPIQWVLSHGSAK